MPYKGTAPVPTPYRKAGLTCEGCGARFVGSMNRYTGTAVEARCPGCHTSDTCPCCGQAVAAGVMH